MTAAPLPESRFTAATPLCPFPERWSSTDGDSTEREVAELLGGLVRGLQPDLCLETGTAFGETAEQIGIALAANGHGHLLTIEADEVRARGAALRLQGLPVTALCGDSLDIEIGVIPRELGPIEFAFFDSYYPLRVPEFRRFQPFMRRGTIVCFHDTAPGHARDPRFPDSDILSTVARALRGEIRFANLPTPRGLLIGEVLNASG